MSTSKYILNLHKGTKSVSPIAVMIILLLSVFLTSCSSPSTTSFLSQKLKAAGFCDSIHPRLVLDYDRIQEGHDYDYLQVYSISDTDIQVLIPFANTCGCGSLPLPDSFLESWLCDTTFHKSIIGMISAEKGFWFVDKTKHLYVIDTENNTVYLRYCNYLPLPVDDRVGELMW